MDTSYEIQQKHFEEIRSSNYINLDLETSPDLSLKKKSIKKSWGNKILSNILDLQGKKGMANNVINYYTLANMRRTVVLFSHRGKTSFNFTSLVEFFLLLIIF